MGEMTHGGGISAVVMAQVLGSAVRWRILKVLARGDALLTVEVAEEIGVAASSLSRHMRLLLKAGMVTQNRAGQYGLPEGRLVSADERVVDYGICLLRLKGVTRS